MKKKILALGLVLALVGVLVMPMTVLAGTDDSVVSGTLSSELTLQAPGDIVLPALSINTHVGSSTGSVYSTTTWTLAVADADVAAAGQDMAPGYLIHATKQAVTSTTTGLTTTIIASGLTGANDYWNGWSIVKLTGTGAGQVKTVTDWVLGTTTLTVDAFAEISTSGDTYKLFMPLKAIMLYAATDPGDTTIAGYQTEFQALPNYGLITTSAWNIPLWVKQVRAANDVLAGVYSVTLTYTVTAT